MKLFFRIALFVAGVVNFIPMLIAFFPSKVQDSYGIEVPDVNLELLIRHRAILFGIIGGFMIYASVLKKYFNAATAMGLISMVSFIALFYLIGDTNNELTKVMWIDLVATFLLILGFVHNQR